MARNNQIFRRSVAGLLAFIMVFGIVAAYIPGLVTQSAAVQPQTLAADHVNNRDKKDGLYIFYPAGNTGLAMDVSAYGTQGQEINTVLDYAKTDVTQRFVVQVDEKLTDAVTYGIRSVNSAYWLGSAASGSKVVQTANKNYRNDTCRWKFIPNDDGTMLIQHYSTGNYFCWGGYGTANLVMPAFYDAHIGVTISYETGLSVKDGYNGVHVFDKDGGTLKRIRPYFIRPLAICPSQKTSTAGSTVTAAICSSLPLAAPITRSTWAMKTPLFCM